jgi:hypothetical protein
MVFISPSSHSLIKFLPGIGRTLEVRGDSGFVSAWVDWVRGWLGESSRKLPVGRLGKKCEDGITTDVMERGSWGWTTLARDGVQCPALESQFFKLAALLPHFCYLPGKVGWKNSWK